MKRIHRAINEGLDKSLMNFDDNVDFKKSKNVRSKLFKEFHIGDYVYKDPKLGYNNYIGEKVAICVNDEIDKELYAVLDHQLQTKEFKWANKNTRLYNDCPPEFNNGLENTLHILDNYRTDLKGTIWEQLGLNEYIPSKDELLTIYNNCIDTKLWDVLGFGQNFYWSSSLFPSSDDYSSACIVHFGTGVSFSDDKSYGFHLVALLHIN